MRKRGKIYEISQFAIIFFWIIFTASVADAELRIESVTPDQGVAGQELNVTITGTGFDENTRVFMYMDRMLSSVDTPGKARRVALAGDIAFVADAYRGLQIVDVSDPRNPVIIGSVNTLSDVYDVALFGNLAFVTGELQNEDLIVLDVSDPRNPVILGSVDNSDTGFGFAINIALSGDLAFVVDWPKGLQFINVSDPQNPVIVGYLDTYAKGENIFDAASSGNIVFVTTSETDSWDQHALKVVDASDPQNPVIISSVDIPDARSVELSGDFAFVTCAGGYDQWNGMKVVDVSDPNNPAVIGSVDTLGWPQDLTLSGDLAFLAESENLQVVNLSDPHTPLIIASVDTSDNNDYNSNGVALSDNFAFIADGDLKVCLKPVEISPITVSSETSISVTLPGSAYPGRYSLSVFNETESRDLPGAVLFSPDRNPISAEHSMTIRGDGYFKGEKIKNDGYEIAAFGSGGKSDCRGKADINETGGKWTYHLTAASDTQGEEITFRIWDSSTGQIYRMKDTMSFKSDTDTTYSLDASLKIGSVSPDRGTAGQELAMTITGTGFDENIKVFIYPDEALGSVNTPDEAYDVALSGNTAFVAGGSQGLWIVDVTDPQNPVITDSVNTPNAAYGLALSGNTAFVAAGPEGLEIMDISDPKVPVMIGSADTPGYALDVALYGSFAYIADDQGCLQVVDVSDPKNPLIVGSMNTPGYAYDATFFRDTAFVADNMRGDWWVEMSDPPVLMSSTELGRDIGGPSGLEIVDVSDPQNPIITESLDTPDVAYGVALSGDLAFIAAGSAGLQVLDISDPQHPIITGILDTPGYARDVALSGNLVFVADKEGLRVWPVPVEIPSVTVSSETELSVILPATARLGRHTLNIVNKTDNSEYIGAVTFSDPENPLTLTAVSPNRIDPGSESAEVTLTGTGFDENTAVSVYLDFSDSPAAADTGSLNIPGSAGAVATDGEKACVTVGKSLQVIDISRLESPVVISSLDISGDAVDVAFSDHHSDLICLADTDGLQLIGIWDESPEVIGTIDIPGSARSVAINDDTAFVAAGNILQMIDISPSLSVIRTAEIPEDTVAVAVAESEYDFYIFYVLTGDTLQVIDETAAWHEEDVSPFVGSVNIPGEGADMAVSGDYAYVAVGERGVQVVSVSDPESPVVVGFADAPGNAAVTDIAVIGKTVYAAWMDPEAQSAGLYIIDASLSESPFIIESVSMPGIPADMSVSGDTACVIWKDWEGGESGMTVISPLPAVITPESLSVESDTRITLTLPVPEIPGNYTLRVHKQYENAELPGTVTFPLPGDITGDWRINLPDAVAALKTLSGIPGNVREDYASAGADVNGDDNVGLAEVIYILRDAAGMR